MKFHYIIKINKNFGKNYFLLKIDPEAWIATGNFMFSQINTCK